MITKINEILDLAQADKTAKKKEKWIVPSKISDDSRSVINGIVELLDPLSVLTDTFQADGVTSSLIIPGLLDVIISNKFIIYILLYFNFNACCYLQALTRLALIRN